MARLTTKKINAAIRERGGEEILVKGDGYFYFAEGEAHTWYSTMVMVPRLNDLTLDRWMEEYEDLKNSSSLTH